MLSKKEKQLTSEKNRMEMIRSNIYNFLATNLSLFVRGDITYPGCFTAVILYVIFYMFFVTRESYTLNF